MVSIVRFFDENGEVIERYESCGVIPIPRVNEVVFLGDFVYRVNEVTYCYGDCGSNECFIEVDLREIEEEYWDNIDDNEDDFIEDIPEETETTDKLLSSLTDLFKDFGLNVDFVKEKQDG